ncbi:4-(cytidine 5'-diphospho)-2-C-methyl-D-erythritol kinase [Mucisphaera calidilacus]|uniref:4-diphosphocytidyl-2-C-methyl-D-erythritol kinase n=1 Tax=Mucisphaera calidilacus TaxID=2527982 RepID=A0A518BV90_9BACT|nr:4-(cytidine 5'-diphospho)-2-C-methyl-D-erythritol kinase [Mucisphaera calidilacus]QDU70889.1 4-diphosphocytidyl-2-C-methyl-D-erythritol kinase [Mucisphaera calidilacus]
MTLTRASPAKLNLALSVGAPDANGYHPLASWMVATEFHDTLTLEHADRPSLDVRFASDALGQHTVDWPSDKDLTWRALLLLAQHTGHQHPLRITVEKRIPPGGGLGGGSGNAATLLVAANQYLDLKLSDTTLKSHAAQLGSDVPFFIDALQGRPSCLATGYGEQLTPAPHPHPLSLVLIWPGIGAPTGPVYKTFDQLNPNAAVNLPAVRNLINSQPLGHDQPFNDLARPAMHAQPALRDQHQRITNCIERPVHITGSGSTLYVIARDDSEAHTIATQITDRLKLDAVATKTLADQ